MRVLVLDDDPEREGLHRALCALGATPLAAMTCAEAVVIIDEGIDAALINLEVGANDNFFGFGSVEYIRDRDRATPIVGYVAEDNALVRAMCRHLNVRDTVKPLLLMSEFTAYFEAGQLAREGSGVRVSAELRRSEGTPDLNVESNRHIALKQLAVALLNLGPNLRQALTDLEDCAIARVLDANGGKLRPSALELGIDRRSLQYRLRQRKR